MKDRQALEWTLEVRAKDKKQLKKFMKYIIGWGFYFTYEQVWAHDHEEYVLTVTGCWGDHIETMGKILGEEDRWED